MEHLLSLPKHVAVFITSMLPVFELRGSIPLGFYLDLPIVENYLLSVIGNLIPVIPIYLLLQPVSSMLSRIKIFEKFFKWLFNRTKQKGQIIERYEAIGLMIFVAVPLPITGAWTGTIAAVLFKIRLKYTMFAVSLGVCIAGIIVSLLCLLGKVSWSLMT